jgi:hypothetical protein
VGLRNGKLVEQVQSSLQLGEMSQRHYNHIAFTILGDEDGFVGGVSQARYLVGLIAEIRDWLDDRHGIVSP